MAAASFRHRRGCFLSRRTGEGITTGPGGASALAAVATLPPVRPLPWRSVRRVSVWARIVRRVQVWLWTGMVRRLWTRMVWVQTWSVLGLVVRPSEKHANRNRRRSSLLAQSGHARTPAECSPLGVKRTHLCADCSIPYQFRRGLHSTSRFFRSFRSSPGPRLSDP
jgi:hypothetical protein